jgi:hypothetical protein
MARVYGFLAGAFGFVVLSLSEDLSVANCQSRGEEA